jgi:hypothetical protein
MVTIYKFSKLDHKSPQVEPSLIKIEKSGINWNKIFHYQTHSSENKHINSKCR